MANSTDKARKEEKAAAVIARLGEIHDSRELLIGMLDEVKHLIIGLGIGTVNLRDAVRERAA